MTDVVGYLDRWTAQPGGRVAVHLSSAAPGAATVTLIRLGCGEQRDEPDGIVFEAVDSVPAQAVTLRHQPVDAGSYAQVEGLADLPLADASLAVLVQPWLVSGAEQVVVALQGADVQRSLRVAIDGDGRVALRVGEAQATSPHPVFARRWSLWLLHWCASSVHLDIVDVRTGRRNTLALPLPTAPPAWRALTLAGVALQNGTVGAHFDGRLERPVLWPSAVSCEAALHAVLRQSGLPDGALACWDFAPHEQQSLLPDHGPHALHGRLEQGPKRAVRGARWSGSVFDWRQAPGQYAAAHFHRDDLTDAQWQPDVWIALPPDLRSGAYAVRIQRDDAGDDGSLTGGLCRLPLFVRPATAPSPGDAVVAVVFPTFTYLAYANDRCAWFGHNPEVLADQAITLEPTDVLLSHHPQWGLSLYDTHRDGAGVSTTSRWRPIPGFQPDQRAWQAGEGSGRWNYPGDLLLVEWLEREGIAWHAFTDDDLHAHGSAVLAPYRTALTGNHPEYATTALLDAYRGFVAGGGRMIYLGGNGFYWKVACHPQHDGVLELRRAEDGNRSWAEEPGEYYHAFDGGYGGLWRRNGVAPQSWLGVGYSGQGFRRSVGYERTAESDLPQVAFVFDGVPARSFGTQGVIGGGCAGVEVDRQDAALGSDPLGIRLASSVPFDATYFVANEELLVSRPTISGPFSPGLRADVVLQASAGGGAVFCTGSIAWVGGLAAVGGDPHVQRITRNVLTRFLDPAPLEVERGEAD